MNTPHYGYRIQWSDEDAAFVATSPEFPTLSGLGDTAQQALTELDTALAGTLEIYADEGWVLPKPLGLGEEAEAKLCRMVAKLELSDDPLDKFIATVLWAEFDLDSAWIEEAKAQLAADLPLVDQVH